MRILITGGTGLIGRALCRHWRAQGHELWVWSRSPERVSQLCSGAHGVAQLEDLNGQGPIDAVVNLAGAPIADRPWTPARRKVLWRSRIDLTHTLVAWMQQQPQPALLSAAIQRRARPIRHKTAMLTMPPPAPPMAMRLPWS